MKCMVVIATASLCLLPTLTYPAPTMLGLSQRQRTRRAPQQEEVKLTRRLSNAAEEELKEKHATLSVGGSSELHDLILSGVERLLRDGATPDRVSQAESNIRRFVDKLAAGGQVPEEITSLTGHENERPDGGAVGSDVDLSGTYTGTLNAPDMNLSGPATLTITGNTFTLDAGGNQQSGTLTAHQWPGQIAVSMRFGTTLPATSVSLRARRMGASGLSLTSVKGEAHSLSFTTSGGGRARQITGESLKEMRLRVCPLYPFC